MKLVDEFNIASKLAMVAQAKLGHQQLKAAEDCKKLLGAQKRVALKEEEVAKMLTEIASMKLDVGRLNAIYLTQQMEVQRVATELYTADSVVREKMVKVNSHLLGGARFFGEGGNDVRVKAQMKRDGEANLMEAEELLLEQQKAEKVAAEKAAAAKVAAEAAANAALAAKKEEQNVAKLRSQAAALAGRNAVETVPAAPTLPALPRRNAVVTAPPKFTGARRKEPPPAKPRVGANTGNRVWPDNINLPVKIGLVKVVEDQIPGSHEQYK